MKKTQIKKWLRLVKINAIVFLAMLMVLNQISYYLHVYYFPKDPYLMIIGAEEGQIEDLPTFKDEPHFKEFLQNPKPQSVYYDFIGWKQQPMQSKYINIDSTGFRMHPHVGTADSGVVWCFGGSTMYGHFQIDKHTIPAWLDSLAEDAFITKNFGHSSYVARQELASLVNQLTTRQQPDAVVFYDGANDVLQLCKPEENLMRTSRESSIRKSLQGGPPTTSWGIFDDVLNIADRMFWRWNKQAFRQLGEQMDGTYDKENLRELSYQYCACGRSDKKVQQVARHITQVWKTAHALCQSKGVRFYAVLQPTAYIGQPTTGHISHIEKNEALKIAYGKVYRQVLRIAKAEGMDYVHDFSQLLNGKEPYYADWCHINAKGNLRIAQRMHQMLTEHDDH